MIFDLFKRKLSKDDEIVKNLENKVGNLESEIYSLKTELKSAINEINTLTKQMDDLKEFITNIHLDENFRKNVFDLVDNLSNVERHKIEKLMLQDELRSRKDYGRVMAILNHMITDLVDNLFLVKYASNRPEENPSRYVITTQTRINDMTEIYTNLLKTSSTAFIRDDLGAFYEIYGKDSKDWFLSNFIAPIYNPKMDAMIKDLRERMNSLATDESEFILKPETDLPEELTNIIDELYEKQEG